MAGHWLINTTRTIKKIRLPSPYTQRNILKISTKKLLSILQNGIDMEELKLYMLLLGCRPAGRFTEQHDILFGIGTSLKDLKGQIVNAWPEVKGNIHIDAWREVRHVNGLEVNIVPKGVSSAQTESYSLLTWAAIS